MDDKPKNIDECLDALIRDTPKEDLDKFKEMEEQKAGASVHFAGGNWGLWDEKSSLAKWFHSIGIWHADDMSGIIFDSLHRELNGKPIDLVGQVQQYHNYWKKIGINPEEELNKVR